jgi:hypothetical protein
LILVCGLNFNNYEGKKNSIGFEFLSAKCPPLG